MKIKSFLAVLLAGLVCVTSFTACDDDKDDDKTYGYQLVLELTEPGDIPADLISQLNQAFKTQINTVGTQYLTKSDAKKLFNQLVSTLQKSFDSVVKDNHKTVKITIGFFNSGTQKLDFSHTFEFKPVA